MQIQDSVVVITGASMGIGEAAAVLLAGKGAKIASLSRSAGDIPNKVPGALHVPVDVTDFDAFRAALASVRDHFGKIDVLVNNAGKSYEALLLDIDLDIFDEIYRLNVVAPIVGMQTVIPWMREAGAGSIVNISSGTTFMAIPGYGVYSSSKRALNGLSLTARAELEKEGVLVSTVYPFLTATNFGVNRVISGEGRIPVDYSKGDPPEHVASLIAQAIEEGGAEYFANERLRGMARSNA